MAQPAIKPSVRVLFAALLAVWVAVHIVGFIVGDIYSSGHAKIPLEYRISASLVLVLCGWIWLAVVTPRLRMYATLSALGMTFGCLGDMAMGKVIPCSDSLIAGMILFALCHLFYTAGYLNVGGLLGLRRAPVRAVSVVLMLIVALLAWLALVNSPDVAALRNYGALGYCAIIAVMAGFAIALAIEARQFVPLALGALLFLASDVLLAACMFRGYGWYLVNDFIWCLYIVGEALIVFGPAYAIRYIRTQKTVAGQDPAPCVVNSTS